MSSVSEVVFVWKLINFIQSYSSVHNGHIITLSLTQLTFFMKASFPFETLFSAHVYDAMFKYSEIFLLLRRWICSTRCQRIHHVELRHKIHASAVVSILRKVDCIHGGLSWTTSHDIWNSRHLRCLLLLLVLVNHLGQNFLLLFMIALDFIKSTSYSTENHVFLFFNYKSK